MGRSLLNRISGRRLTGWTLLATAGFVALSACTNDEPETVAEPGAAAGEIIDGGAALVVANSPGTLTTSGTQRVLVAILGDGPNQFLGSDDQPVDIELRTADGSAGGTVEGDWLSPETTSLGLYVARYEFATPGVWEVTIVGAGPDMMAQINVATESAVPGPGDPAPASDTPTAAAAAELAAITTDPEPLDRLYARSIAEAVTSGQPTVVAFATPAFCQTALCGPTLEAVKAAANNHPAINFVHVEPFDLEAARDGVLEPVPAMTEWGLATEPWVFVIDAEGVVVASFEGVISGDELATTLAAV